MPVKKEKDIEFVSQVIDHRFVATLYIREPNSVKKHAVFLVFFRNIFSVFCVSCEHNPVASSLFPCEKTLCVNGVYELW